MKQNILKRWLVVLLVALVGGPAALAQQSKIAVASFTRMETDITARVTAPKKDQNGEICALIRIVTNVKDLMFEPDALGITARENKTGEIWVYVPRGARRISILHDELGILRNYFYPEIIEKGTVYEMVLNTGDAQDKPWWRTTCSSSFCAPNRPTPTSTLTTNWCLSKTVCSRLPCPRASTPTA